MDLERLRTATAPDHDRAESAMPVMAPNLDLRAYVAILQRLHGFVLGWETWAQRAASEPLRQLLAQRTRSHLLAADLAHFSTPPAAPLYPGPALSLQHDAEVLGAIYVMEGSTLGGQYIARHLEQFFQLEPGVGDAFFRGHGQQTGALWRQIKDSLAALPEAETDSVIRAAKTLFADFSAWNQLPSEGAHV